MVLIGAALATGCVRRYDQGTWTFGTAMVINVRQVHTVEQAAYQDGDKFYVVRPSSSGRKLVAALVTVVNQESTVVSMLVTPQAAYVEDARGNRFYAVDPFSQREEAASPPPVQDLYNPLLWGKMELTKGYEITGWMVFEAPATMETAVFGWEQVETLRVRL